MRIINIHDILARIWSGAPTAATTAIVSPAITTTAAKELLDRWPNFAAKPAAGCVWDGL